MFNIADYGATPAAATAGINAAALAAYTAGGGMVYIPPGTWIITVSPTTYAVRCYPGVSFAGAGKGLSILKVADAQGVWSKLFGHESGEPLRHLTFRDFSVDYNGANNQQTAADHARYAIHAPFGAVDVTISDVGVLNAICTNVFYFGSGSQAITVEDCAFENTGDNGATFDHSTVYLSGDMLTVKGCRFIAAPGGKMAVTAIEVHGSHQHIEGNTVVGYQVGQNVCGTGEVASDSVYISGNHFSEVRHGLQLWSLPYGSNTIGPALRDVHIVNNTFSLDADGAPGTYSVAAITLANYLMPILPIDNLRIAENIIRLLPISSYAYQSADSLNGAAINLWLDPALRPAYPSHHWQIADNIIDGALSCGVLVGSTIDSLDIARCWITNPAQSPMIATDQKAGICIDGADVGHLIVNHNEIVDSRVPARLTAGIRILDVFPPHYQIVGNYVVGENVPVIGGSAFMPPDSEVPYWTLTHHAWNGPTAEEVQRYAVGA